MNRIGSNPVAAGEPSALRSSGEAATQNVNVRNTSLLVTPAALKAQFPISDAVTRSVLEGRSTICHIIEGRDPRMMVVVGPCSIHDEKAALEYSTRLLELSRQVSDRLLLVMRVYFEKPRTTIGWKGLINDPHLNGTFDIETGLKKARKLLLTIAATGMPTATEMLDPITPQYVADLVSWAAIGARTIESQTHREMASGLSMPVGYKNSTDGNLQIAMDALKAAGTPHAFLGIDEEGRTSVVTTKGNPWGHLILRGGRSGTNYDREHVEAAVQKLEKAGMRSALMVDCSHANSGKDHHNQQKAWKSVVAQRAAGCRQLVGLMLESHLEEGNQPLGSDPAQLRYGVSITDACLGWDATRDLILHAHAALAPIHAAA